MQQTQSSRSTRLFKKNNTISNLYLIEQNRPSQHDIHKPPTFKTIISVGQSISKDQCLTKKNNHPTFQENLIETSNKDIQKLCNFINQNLKSQQVYEEIDLILSRYHIHFFQNVRNFLLKQQYHQLIDKCQWMCFSQNGVLSKKGNKDQFYYILIDGQISYNQEKIHKNILSGTEEIQYIRLFFAQKGQLLNPETLNIPKHNTYTIITHSPVKLIVLKANEVYTKLLKKYFNKESDQKSQALSNTSLFKDVSSIDIKRFLPYFFLKNFYKFNQFIYRQDEPAEFVYWILNGEVQLIKQEIYEDLGSNSFSNENKKIYKIVKLSKFQIFGIDQHIFKPASKYMFSARVCSQTLKTVCISYRSLNFIQGSYPCINENIDFYLKRAAVIHSKIVQKNQKIIELKQNIRIIPKKKNKRNRKKKKNPTSMQWWGLAQNFVGSKKYKFQLPKFITNQQKSLHKSKSEPMFNSLHQNSRKIEQFKKKILQKEVKQMISDEQNKNQLEQIDQSPYKISYMPRLNKLKIKTTDAKHKIIDQTEKMKKKLLSYAKNVESFCEKLDFY